MAKIGGRLIAVFAVFLIIYNINIVFATKYDRYRIDVENEYDRVQNTTVSTVTRESNSLFDTLTKAEGVVASQSTLATSPAVNTSENTVQEEREIEDEVSENERKCNSTLNQIEGHHQYYNSTICVDKERVEAYWNKIQNIPASKMLSHSYRRAMTVVLSFDFPFYGHPVRNVTVSTGGFIYTGDYVHSWLAATQYIAPLMANFDTNLSKDSFVRLNDTGSSFTVLWENVYLQDQQDVGKFTFSTTLYKNGDIVFTYFSVPILPKAIREDEHFVKVGLSDAYIIEKPVYFARGKTIHEYHKVNFSDADIIKSTIITLKALPTCLEYTDCASCVNHVTAFNCSWCPTVNRCSSGTDRQRQDWLSHGCDEHHVTEEDSCLASVSETFTKEESEDASEARIDVENEYDRVQNTTVPTVTRESSNLFDTLTKAKGVDASQSTLATSPAANSSDNTLQEEKDTEDDVSENEKKCNSTVNQIEGHHRYYNSTICVDKERVEAYWNKIRNIPADKLLSHSHRRAKIFTLSFDFPFYGHLVKNVTVSATGFLFTGDYVHSYLAASQYIAPLMANFDTSLSNDSFVRLNDTGSSFTVLWENVYLQDQQDVGKFTFSTTLHKNGDIVFTYFSVPILPKAIEDDKHLVRVGLSDAYIIEKVVYFALRKTIHEYHRVNFVNADISNSTIITLKALPTCLEYTDCASCINHVTEFKCSWCPTVNRCSSGLDRQIQDWLGHGCDQHHLTEEGSCSASVSETFTKEESVDASEATLITSVTTNSIDGSVEKEEESSVTDNSSDSREQEEEVTSVTANSNDDTVQKDENITKEKSLNTENVPENTTLKASQSKEESHDESSHNLVG